MKLLIVIDVQIDFVYGALRNEEAIKKLPNVCKMIEEWDGLIYFTKDTHYDNYLNTLEGKKLDIPHCILGTDGWELCDEIKQAFVKRLRKLNPTDTKYKSDEELLEWMYEIPKQTFGYKDWNKEIDFTECEEIHIIGYCTDICVISNALIIKAISPNTPIFVHKDCCAGVDKDRHENALKAMECCHIEIV